ncbi:MAG TPA: hypothetical protein VK470_17190 [Bacteroidota bacterium]|nr:hypothetical protein [Bacteroidota bacterium]
MEILLLLLCLLTAASYRVDAQTADTSAANTTPASAVQFQLLGGFGINYLGSFGETSSYRIGLDLSLNHTNQWGENNGSIYIDSSSPYTSRRTSTGGSDDKTSTEYSATLNILYLERIAHYKKANLYYGFGPMASYSRSKISISTRDLLIGSGSESQDYNSSENIISEYGAGPLLMTGVSTHVINAVTLSAEFGLSVKYIWSTTTSSLFHTSTYGTINAFNSERHENSSTSDGWTISLTAIRIGCIIEL